MTRLYTCVTLIFLILTLACGSSIQPISLKNPVLSEESRQLLADTEDAVSIRQAERDDAQLKFEQAQARRTDLLEGRDWPSNASGALRSLAALEDARVKLAGLDRDVAQTQLEYAQSKYDLTTAQTAMRHDLAVYDLEPLRETVKETRAQLEGLQTAYQNQRITVDKKEKSWWQAYATFVNGGGDSSAFYQNAASYAKSPE